MDMLQQNSFSEQLLNIMPEKEFYSGFIDITRPANDEGSGSCRQHFY